MQSGFVVAVEQSVHALRSHDNVDDCHDDDHDVNDDDEDDDDEDDDGDDDDHDVDDDDDDTKKDHLRVGQLEKAMQALLKVVLSQSSSSSFKYPHAQSSSKYPHNHRLIII